MATKDREIESLKAKVRTQTQDQCPQVSESSGDHHLLEHPRGMNGQVKSN